MAWTIYKINNQTHKVTLINEKGQKIAANIPFEHKTHEAKQAYLMGHGHGYECRHKNLTSKSKITWAIIMLQSLVIIGLILYKMH